MKNYLITGIAGTGKTTVADALRDKGFIVIETDDDFRISIKDMQNIDPDFLPSKTWANDGRGKHIIDPNKVLPLLTQSGNGTQFLCGHGRNWIDYAKYFEKVFLFTLNDGKLIERFSNRSKGQ